MSFDQAVYRVEKGKCGVSRYRVEKGKSGIEVLEYLIRGVLPKI